MQRYQEPQSGEIELDLKRIFLSIWKRKVIVVAVAAILALVSYLWSALFLTPLYQSSFTAYIDNRVSQQGSTTSSGDLSAALGLMHLYAEVVESRSVLTEAAQSCGFNFSYESLQNMVSCELPESVAVCEVVVTMADPQQAYDLANAVAKAAGVHLSEVIEGSSMRIIDPPVLCMDKVWPGNVANGVKGGLVGALFSCLSLAVFDIIEDKVRDEKELEERHQIPVIGIIPDMEQAEKSGDRYGYARKGGRR